MGKEDWYDHQFKWPCSFAALVLILPLILAGAAGIKRWRKS